MILSMSAKYSCPFYFSAIFKEKKIHLAALKETKPFRLDGIFSRINVIILERDNLTVLNITYHILLM